MTIFVSANVGERDSLGDQAAERRADSRSGDASVGGAPLNVGKHCLLASAVLSLVVIKYICTYAY